VRTCMLAELDQTGRVRSILVGYWCAWRHRLGRRNGEREEGLVEVGGGSLVCLTVWLEMPLPAARRASGALNLP
jgi:hypothetical protein